MTPLAAALRARIAAHGPLRLDAWMAACNGHYYATRDPLGQDFTTAPEISQMFGELVGGCIGDLWQRAGSPPARLVELGPGRGTLMADARRVLARVPGFGERVALHLVETSPVLRAAQAARLAGAVWHDDFGDVPGDRPVMVVANEFFDALPIRRFDGRGGEAAVGVAGARFVATTLPVPGTTTGEVSEAGKAIAAAIGARLRAQGGAALIVDYGGLGPHAETLQALRGGAPVDPFADPGEADLTAHVDFAALARAAGVASFGPVPQGVWLARLGIEARAAQLRAAVENQGRARIDLALLRLTRTMGALFKAQALVAPGWPAPAGFDA
ncbi:hypothetical protein IP88_03925 [alpha proteobacterium AAP81b]|nr:hypothetical protein IP88_03925 [alpha proteobacterium AAP81b]